MIRNPGKTEGSFQSDILPNKLFAIKTAHTAPPMMTEAFVYSVLFVSIALVVMKQSSMKVYIRAASAPARCHDSAP